MKINKILTFILTFCFLVLSACANSPDEVKIASTKEIQNYAQKHYGSASSYEVTEEENRRSVTFVDKEYGFSYTVTSYAMEQGIDGSTFGYSESKSSDFSGNYYQVLYGLAEEKFDAQYDINYGYCGDDWYTCFVYNVNMDNAESITQQIGDYLKKLDTRNYYQSSDTCVAAYVGEKESYIGSWHVAEGKYYYYADEKYRKYDEYFKWLV